MQKGQLTWTRNLILSVLSCAGLQTACVTRGRDFSSDLGWVKKSQTTQNDVTKFLGTPTAVGSTGGVPTWTYGYYDYRLFGESETKEIKFYWNNDGKLQDFSFNSSFPSDRQRLMMAPR
ncbi:MAG: outer membrane protein assembly factor BamE [Proteobacteria bacterium]|nr:outer membrane protein assembly factor BamE [Pseudomonadota bacterium]